MTFGIIFSSETNWIDDNVFRLLSSKCTLPFDFLTSDITFENIQNIHSLTIHLFYICLIRLSVIKIHIILRPPRPLCLVWHRYKVGFLTAIFLTDWTKKEKSMWKINVSRFPPAWTTTRWNLSWRGKNLTFCTGVNSAFVCQPTWFFFSPQNLLYVSDLQFHMASLHSSEQKYLQFLNILHVLPLNWMFLLSCTWWIEFLSPGASDNYSKAAKKLVRLSFLEAGLLEMHLFHQTLLTWDNAYILKASRGAQCSAKHKYITLNFTWAPF